MKAAAYVLSIKVFIDKLIKFNIASLQDSLLSSSGGSFFSRSQANIRVVEK